MESAAPIVRGSSHFGKLGPFSASYIRFGCPFLGYLVGSPRRSTGLEETSCGRDWTLTTPNVDLSLGKTFVAPTIKGVGESYIYTALP